MILCPSGVAKKGFTLIELLVVISIISLLATTVLASLNSARVKARNVQRLSNITQYKLAFEFAVDDNDEYPDTGDGNWRCLGDYPDDLCWSGTIPESVTLNGILRNYFPSLPATLGLVRSWEGAIYRCSLISAGICRTIDVRWFMEGANQQCAGEIVIDPNYSGLGITYCQLVRSI